MTVGQIESSHTSDSNREGRKAKCCDTHDGVIVVGKARGRFSASVSVMFIWLALVWTFVAKLSLSTSDEVCMHRYHPSLQLAVSPSLRGFNVSVLSVFEELASR